jgi:hypothetical protein
MDGPPVIDTFLSSPCEKKPTHWPSGEKNGERGLVIQRSGTASS